jgi:cellulose synthase (UDP-forming)
MTDVADRPESASVFAALTTVGTHDHDLVEVGDRPIEAFTRVWRGWDRAAISVLMACWVVLLVTFWVWWAEPVHQVSATRTAVDAFLLAYMTVILPALPVVYLLRVRRVNPELPVPFLRVALVVTKAPSEPWDLVKATLRAMQHQDAPFPYDVWICDENPSKETLRWCAKHDVHVSTRHGVEEYHQLTWPRRTKCKEGNLAYFYDHWGYDDYDVVVQLDADHVPTPRYLRAMVQPFREERVGYVAAPSICDSNSESSWSARGRLHKEASLHGPSQAGCNDGFAPVCIGSHYAVRTQALQEIGGIGPELAEDFTTSFLLTSAGWEGVFALDAEAHGEGPPTFPAMLTQEFQWSQSLTVVTLGLFFRHVRQLPWKLRLRYTMSLLYYPMLALTTIVGLAMAPIAVVSGEPWMNVNWFAFIGRWMLLSVPLLLATTLLRQKRVLRPVDAKILSWEVWLYSLARWPFVTWGFCSGLKERLFPKPRTIKVTPKGDRAVETLPVRFFTPFLAVCAVTIAAVWFRSRAPSVRYYVILCLLSAGTYLLVTTVITLLHAVETRRSTGVTWSDALVAVRGCLVAVAVVGAAWLVTVVVVVPGLLAAGPP